MAKKFIYVLFCIMFLNIFAACDFIASHHPGGIKPGMSSDLVQQNLGSPDDIFPDELLSKNGENFAEIWVYSQQPMGKTCYMIHFENGVVRYVEQVLDNFHFKKILPGLSQEDVVKILGKPASQTTFENLNEKVLEWHISGDTPFDEYYFDVHFDLNTQLVKKTSQRMVGKN